MAEGQVVKRALEQIRKRAVNYEYFFDHLASPEWIRPLLEEGMFQEPPPPRREGDYVSFPFWPESRYLARMAPIAPRLVLDVALQIRDTENVRVYEDLADAALAMPADMAASLVPRLKVGLASPYQLLLPEKLGKLVSHLASGGEIEEALNLARALLAVLPDPRVTNEDLSSEDAVFRPTPQARFHTWRYGEILRNEIPVLVDTAGTLALELLCNLLEKALWLSERPRESRAPRDASYIWRPAIEADDKRPEELKDLLVSAVRDAAERLMHKEGKQVLRIVEEFPFKVFQRIGLHLRRRWPQVDPEGTAELAKDEDVFDDIDLWHELFHLLKDRFDRLPSSAQEGYLALVNEGPDIDRWLAFKQRSTGQAPTADQIGAYVRHWQYKKLLPIQAYLRGEWRQRSEAFRQEFGEIDHPDFHYYEHPVWSGPTSPKRAEELVAMTVEELIAFLSSWKPSGDWMSPTPEGLGRMLQAVVADNPERYATHAGRFQGLDPTYVRGILMGLEEAAKQSKTFPWSPVIKLCHWVVEQPREIPGRKSEYADLDPGWGWTRKAIASLLSKGFEDGVSEIPYSFRSVAWEVLEPLTEDPEPTPAYEAQYGSPNLDPATLSINTVRGEGMHAVVRYALWVRRHRKNVDREEGHFYGFEEIPEVRQVLDRHLDWNHDPSPAVRSVYGQWFPWLVLLDAAWVANSVSRIFPTDDVLHDLRDAAWNAYIIFCSPYDNAVELLQGEYLAAIERICSGSDDRGYLANPDEHLAQHLMTLYWRGRLNPDDPTGLLPRFYETADDALRAHALSFVGRSLQSTPGQLSHEVTERLKTLWTLRLEAALTHDSSSYVEEMAAFGWWFASAKFDDGWSMSQLKQVLTVTSEVEADHLVAERLAALGTAFPLDCVECLSSLMGRGPTWRFHSWHEHPRTILVTALGGHDERARQAAIALINRLGARGYLQYRDLLPDQL